MEKLCPKCKETKSTSSFNKKTKTKDGLRAYCKDCDRKDAREFYRKNPESYKIRARRHCNNLRKYLYEQMDVIKEKRGCCICGEKTLCTLDFHHFHKKKRAIGQSTHSYSSFQKELHKCVVICANCHRKVHNELIHIEETMLCDEIVPRLMGLQ